MTSERALWSLPLLLVLACSPLAAQRGDVKEGKVHISGENPVIRLSLKEGAPPVTRVSFWRVVYSPVGMGHACYVEADLTGDGASSDDVRMAFTDNKALLDYLDKEIMSAFDKAYVENPYPRQRARFEKKGDTRTGWHEIIRSEHYAIELVWRDFYEPFQLDLPVGGPRLPYGITSLIIPARQAELIVNGRKAAGRPLPQVRWGKKASTAFLAFSETWVK